MTAVEISGLKTLHRIPRPLHPVAWWLWAIGLAVAAARTTNPLILFMLIAVTTFVVLLRAQSRSQIRLFFMYMIAGCVVIVIRMFFAMILGVDGGGILLFTLPTLDLPSWVAGFTIGGPVTVEMLLSAAFDGLRLATLLIVIGAANALADPRRMLKVVPGALYEVGTAVVVALTIAPQIIESGMRIRRAQRLRMTSASDGKRPRVLRGLIIPVLEDSLDRSLALAASMDSRGYGRWGGLNRGKQKVTSVLIIIGLLGACVGAYGVLDPTSPRWLGAPILVGGVLVGTIGMLVGRSRSRPTTYRPDPWGWPEWAVSACGIGAALVMFFSSNIDPSNMYPTVYPLVWPTIPLFAALAGLLAVLPGVLAPPVVISRIHAVEQTSEATVPTKVEIA